MQYVSCVEYCSKLIVKQDGMVATDVGMVSCQLHLSQREKEIPEYSCENRVSTTTVVCV